MRLAAISRMGVELNGPPTIDPDLLVQELRSGRDVVIVDVRSKAEFCAGHIAGSRLIPIHQLVARTCELDTHRTHPVVVVSQDGLRAKVAAGALSLAGFGDVAVLDGGIRRWRELGHPLEDTSDAWSHRSARSAQ